MLLLLPLLGPSLSQEEADSANLIDHDEKPSKKPDSPKKNIDSKKQKLLLKSDDKSSDNKQWKKLTKQSAKSKKLLKDNKSTTTTTTKPEIISQRSDGQDTEYVSVNPRKRLRETLLGGYPKVHPVKDIKEAVKVDLGMALIHLSLEERLSILEVDGWMRLNWTDEYLKWDPEEFENLTQIHFGAQEIWRPDIQLYNNADGNNLAHYGDTHFLVFNTGVVLWVPPAKFRSFCKLDLTGWPQDRQTCKLKFGSWTSHGNQIDLGLFHNMTTVEQLNFYTANKEWRVLETSATRSKTKYDSVPETYPDVTFSFSLERTSPSYRAAVILPCLLTMLLVVSSFIMPPGAGEKLAVNGISFIVCILYLIYFQITLPSMSDHIPVIVMFFSNTAALVGIAIVLNVSCISLVRERRYSGPPKWLKNAFSGFMGRILCLGNYYHQVSETHQRLVVEMDDISDSPESEQTTRVGGYPVDSGGSLVMRDWMLVAAGVERFFFLVYTLAFALVGSAYV